MEELTAENGAAEAWFGEVLAELGSSNGGETLNAALIEAPPGPLLAVADADALLLLEFSGRKSPERLRRLLPAGASLTPGLNGPLRQLKQELAEYFSGTRRDFSVPLRTSGTEFQESVWAELRRIPYGEVIPYAELARRVGRPKAFRAAAQANGANRISIIIPCHRVVNSGGRLGGYGGGLDRKRWLLKLEGAEELR